jgi:hypothetical protein
MIGNDLNLTLDVTYELDQLRAFVNTLNVLRNRSAHFSSDPSNLTTVITYRAGLVVIAYPNFVEQTLNVSRTLLLHNMTPPRRIMHNVGTDQIIMHDILYCTRLLTLVQAGSYSHRLSTGSCCKYRTMRHNCTMFGNLDHMVVTLWMKAISHHRANFWITRMHMQQVWTEVA